MDKNEILRKIPQVDEILKDVKLVDIVSSIPHDFLINCIREVIIDQRANILNGIEKSIDKNTLIDKIIAKVEKKSKHSLRKVINATGTVLHTNLGRAVISKAATESMISVAYNYSNLEYDLKKSLVTKVEQKTESSKLFFTFLRQFDLKVKKLTQITLIIYGGVYLADDSIC